MLQNSLLMTPPGEAFWVPVTVKLIMIYCCNLSSKFPRLGYPWKKGFTKLFGDKWMHKQTRTIVHTRSRENLPLEERQKESNINMTLLLAFQEIGNGQGQGNSEEQTHQETQGRPLPICCPRQDFSWRKNYLTKIVVFTETTGFYHYLHSNCLLKASISHLNTLP